MARCNTIVQPAIQLIWLVPVGFGQTSTLSPSHTIPQSLTQIALLKSHYRTHTTHHYPLHYNTHNPQPTDIILSITQSLHTHTHSPLNDLVISLTSIKYLFHKFHKFHFPPSHSNTHLAQLRVLLECGYYMATPLQTMNGFHIQWAVVLQATLVMTQLNTHWQSF